MAGIGRRIVAYLKGEYVDAAERAKFNFNQDSDSPLTFSGIGCCGCGNTSEFRAADNRLHRHGTPKKKGRWVKWDVRQSIRARRAISDIP